jgi:hypothetical protein
MTEDVLERAAREAAGHATAARSERIVMNEEPASRHIEGETPAILVQPAGMSAPEHAKQRAADEHLSHELEDVGEVAEPKK